MSKREESAALREKAAKCRRLASGMVDDETIAALRRLADAYDRQASDLERADDVPQSQQVPPRAAE